MVGDAQVTTFEEVVDALVVLLEEAGGGSLELYGLPDLAVVPLRSLGLDSGAFIAFVGGIESRFGISWRLDEPPETFATLASIARYVIAEQGAAA
jgi:acyl carrier protein